MSHCGGYFYKRDIFFVLGFCSHVVGIILETPLQSGLFSNDMWTGKTQPFENGDVKPQFVKWIDEIIRNSWQKRTYPSAYYPVCMLGPESHLISPWEYFKNTKFGHISFVVCTCERRNIRFYGWLYGGELEVIPFQCLCPLVYIYWNGNVLLEQLPCIVLALFAFV